jgi:predicted ATPase
MRILGLSLKNIGPFDDAQIEFLRAPEDQPAVTLITGENGTGKSVVLDAIREFFGYYFMSPTRDVLRDAAPFEVVLRHTISIDDTSVERTHRVFQRVGGVLMVDGFEDLITLPDDVGRGTRRPPPWVVDYWRPGLPSGDYGIPALAKIDHRALYKGALQGTLPAARVTEWLCHFDYLRDSHDPDERAVGEAVFDAARRIVAWSLLDGEFVAVKRATLTPMVRQAGQLVPLQNLSSGNAYLIQHMIGLLGRMYSLHMLRGGDPAKLLEASGLLLIDEAENFLHPIWQKRFLPGVRAIFPNLQIVATTHSPFILASVPGARVYVCRYDRPRGCCTITEESDGYASRPVDEIVASAAFDHTQPFGQEITDLLTRRKAAIAGGDAAERERIERELVALNPTHFAYLDIDRELAALRRAS